MHLPIKISHITNTLLSSAYYHKSSDISTNDAMDSASAVEDCTDNAAATIDTSSDDQMATTQSEDTNDISSTTTTDKTTTAISTPTDKAITTPPIPKPSSSSINKLQNVKWRREWRGIHLPPSASVLNSKFYNKNDIVDEIEQIEEVSDEEYVDDVEEVPIEDLPIEVPIVEAEPIKDTPQQQQTSLLYNQNQPSIPLYPLLLSIILYQLFKYLFRKLFNYKKRIRFMRSMKCRINSLGGNYEQFTISQSELEGHIEKLKSRNEKKKREIDDKKKKKGKKKKGKDDDKSDRSGKRDDDKDGDDRGMGDEADENENEGGGGSGSNSGTTNNKSSEQQSGNNNNKGNTYSSANHSTNHSEQAIIQEYKVKVQQLTKQNEVLLLKANQLEVENEQLDNEMEHMMDEMCAIDEKNDSHDGKEIDISGSYSDTIVESLTDDEEEDTLLQELEDAKLNIVTLTKEHQVAKEEVLRLTMEVAKLTSDKEDLEQRLKDEEGKRSSSYDALLAERDVLNDTLVDINKSIQDALDIVSEIVGNSMEQDDTSLEKEDTKTTHELARHSASRLLSQLSRIKANDGLLPPPSPPASPPLSPTSPTDQASFDRLEMGRKGHKKIETSVVSSTVSSPAAGDLCLIDSSSPQRQVDSTRRELFPSQGQVNEVVLLPKVLPPPQPVVKDCTIMAGDSQHTQDSTKASSTSSSSGEESSAGGEWHMHNKSLDNSSEDIVDDKLNQQSISYGTNEIYCSDDEYDGYDNDLIVGFKDSLLNLSKVTAASRDVEAIQRSRGLSKLVRMWSKRSERSKW